MTKGLSRVLSIISMIVLTLSFAPFKAQGQEYTVDEVSEIIDGIITYKLERSGSGDIQDWINGELTSGAGSTAEWYIMTLSQSDDYDFDSYNVALKRYLDNNNVPSATSREKYALALCAAGSNDAYIEDILDNSIGAQGIMSYIYGLHVLNNGYSCSKYTRDGVIDTLLSLQYGDGGWAIFGGKGDIDVTAMTITALAPAYSQRGDVRNAVERGLDFLSANQQNNGGYVSFGTPNAESTAQVLVALSSLGYDANSESRFIKDGHTLIDGMMQYRLDDGSFSHTTPCVQNETATMQVYYSLVSYCRMSEGSSPLLVFDRRQPVARSEVPRPTERKENVNTHTGNNNNSTSNNTGTGNTVADNGTQVQQSESNGTVQHGTTVNSSAATTARSGKKSGNTTATSVSAKTTSAKVKVSSTSEKVLAENKVSEITETASMTAAKSETEKKSSEKAKGDYKPKAIIIIIAAAGVLCVVIFITGKRNYKNFIAVAVAAGVGVTIVLLTDIKTKDEFYNGEKVVKENAIGTVTMTIRCDTIVDKAKNEFVPKDGVILDVTEFDLEDGETVYDILTEASRTYKIPFENTGSSGGAHGMVYISGINYIYEMEYGDLSGWVYHVNGKSPSRNCGEYKLSPGDEIEWLYTCELGYDLNEVYEE